MASDGTSRISPALARHSTRSAALVVVVHRDPADGRFTNVTTHTGDTLRPLHYPAFAVDLKRPAQLTLVGPRDPPSVTDDLRATLGIVSGRRRQGKTYLLDALCDAGGGFMFTATEATPDESLQRLGAQMAAAAGVGVPLRLSDWEVAIDELLAMAADRAMPIVIDEFPYLAKSTPSLPSIVQAALSPRRAQRTSSRARLILCGSALSSMGRLLSGSAPLRGRASLQLTVPTLDYRLAAQFWQLDDPALAARVHAVVGGTPAYRRDYVRDTTPGSLDDFDAWVSETVLNPAGPLFHEARYLLAEEPDIRETAVYHSVLAAVADGHSTRSGIANYVGRAAADLSHHLTVLDDCGLLDRREDAFRRSRATYAIAEPIIRFYSAIMRPAWTQLQRPSSATRVWSSSQDRFSRRILGPHFEQMCRSWAERFASSETFGGPVGHVLSGTINDATRRQQHEVDVVVHSAEDHAQVLSIGEAKWGRTLGVSDVERLRHIRDVLIAGGRATPSTRLALYSGAGFTRALSHDAASTDDLILVDLDRLYMGA